MKMLESILVATDLTGVSAAVPHGAATFAGATRTNVHMLHIIPREFDTEDSPFERGVTPQRFARRRRRDIPRREGGGAAPW